MTATRKPESYPVLNVEYGWCLGTEAMGTKRKFWYQDPSSQDTTKWLFKFPRPNTGEHWAEKIAAEIARLLDIPHAKVELATCDGQRGSTCESFVCKEQVLNHGNELLQEVVFNYDYRMRFHQSSHTIENIWAVMDYVFANTENARQAKIRVSEYLVLDALIGNTDRHHENWGILRERYGKQWRDTVAPSFDHASSLGRELRPERRELLLEGSRIGEYVERGRGAIFRSAEDHHGPSPLQLVRFGFSSYRVVPPGIAEDRESGSVCGA